MSADRDQDHIVVTPGLAGGRPHIAGHRIKVQDIVVWHEHMGRTPDEISAEYGLDLAEIYAALAYYFDHRAEIDDALADREAFIARLRQRQPSTLEQRLNAVDGE